MRQKTFKKIKHLLEIEQPMTTANVSVGNSSQPLFSSLDQAMDRYLFLYEKNALPNAKNPLAENQKLLSKMLFEAGDEMGLDGGGGGLDLGIGDDGGGDEKGEENKPNSLPQTPTINIEKFAGDVARLISNREVLLDLQNTMLRRVNAFMTQNYNPQMAEEFMILLKSNYSLSVESPSQEIQKNQQPISSQSAGDTLGGG